MYKGEKFTIPGCLGVKFWFQTCIGGSYRQIVDGGCQCVCKENCKYVNGWCDCKPPTITPPCSHKVAFYIILKYQVSYNCWRFVGQIWWIFSLVFSRLAWEGLTSKWWMGIASASAKKAATTLTEAVTAEQLQRHHHPKIAGHRCLSLSITLSVL